MQATYTDPRTALLQGLRTQFRTLYRQMACGGQWNVHRGTAGFVLLIDGAHMDVPLPIVLRNVQAMTEETLINRAHAVLSA